MAHLGWFFAGTSLGLFVGVLLTSMAKISEMLRETARLQNDPPPETPRLKIVRR